MPGLYQFVIGKTEHKEDDYKDDKIQQEASVVDKQAIAAKYVNHNELADAKEIQERSFRKLQALLCWNRVTLSRTLHTLKVALDGDPTFMETSKSLSDS